MRLSSLAASLLLLPLAACPEPEPDAMCDEDADPATARDQAALEAWQAQALKTCSLEAVFPHRASFVGTLQSSGVPVGWDTARLLAGADANGVRSFGDDGRAFAGFRNPVPLGADVTRTQTIYPREACDADEPQFSARVELAAGTCTVWIGDQVVSATPLQDTVDVAVAAWPGIAREAWPPPTPPNNLPSLADGFEYVDLPTMPALDAYVRDRRRVEVIAGWLGADPAAATAHLRFELSLGTALVTVPGVVDLPAMTWGDRIPTIATRAEAAALRADGLHAVWHHSGPIEAPTAWDSTIEITTAGLRYTGGQPRDTARAAADAARCVRTLMERDLAAITARRAYAPPFYTSTDACVRLTTDLAAAVAADDAALTLVVAMASDEVRARYGRATATGIAYDLGNRDLHAVLGVALVAGATPLAARPPSAILDHATLSWSALAPRIPASLSRRLATAVVTRAENHFEALAWGHPALPALTDADVAAIAAKIAAAPSPTAESFANDLAWRITREPNPTAP